MIKQKVATVVVTFNRLEFLKEIIEALRKQTRKIDQIIVVHNSGTDGTAEWLAKQKDLYVITQDNFGSSGGQYTGFKAAYDNDFDWIWTMDDDVVPAPDCLEKLLDTNDSTLIRAPLRFMPNGEPYLNDCIKFNLSNPFKGLWTRILNAADLEKSKIDAEGITFEGPLMHRTVIKTIGLPQLNFFIYGDDTEYFIRAAKHGFKTQIYREAHLHRKLEYFREETAFTWKHRYIIRNIIAIDVLHASFIVRLLRPWAYCLKWLSHCRSIGDIRTTLGSFLRGYFYKSAN